jgi:hypothetical protein
MDALENYVSYHSKNLTIFLGKYSFVSLNRLLELLAEIYFSKIMADDDPEKLISDKELGG